MEKPRFSLPVNVTNAASAHGRRYGYLINNGQSPKVPGHFVAGLSTIIVKLSDRSAREK